MATVTLYNYPLAFNPAKAKLALVENNIKHIDKKIDIFNGQSLDASFLKINPSSSVPSLAVGDTIISESSEIVKWSDEQEGGPLGGDKVDRDFIAAWIPKVDAWDGNLFAEANSNMGGLIKTVTDYKIKVAEANAKRNPDLAEIYTRKANCLKAAEGESSDKSLAEANKAQLVVLLDEAEERLSKNKYLAGEEYSIADVIFTPVLYRIPFCKLDKELFDPRDHVKKYWLELKKRPSYKKTFGTADSGLLTAALVVPALAKIYFTKLTGRY